MPIPEETKSNPTGILFTHPPENLGHHLRIFSNLGRVTRDAGCCRVSAPEPATPHHLPGTEKAGK